MHHTPYLRASPSATVLVSVELLALLNNGSLISKSIAFSYSVG